MNPRSEGHWEHHGAPLTVLGIWHQDYELRINKQSRTSKLVVTKSERWQTTVRRARRIRRAQNAIHDSVRETVQFRLGFEPLLVQNWLGLLPVLRKRA